MVLVPGFVFNAGEEATAYGGDGPAALLVRSPNGHRWQFTIADNGTGTWTDLDAA